MYSASADHFSTQDCTEISRCSTHPGRCDAINRNAQSAALWRVFMSATESFIRTPTVATHSIPLLNRGAFDGEPLPQEGVQLMRGPYGSPAVGGTVEIAAVAWMRVLRMTAASHRLVHRPSEDALPSIAMSLQERGASVIEQDDRSARLVPGRWSLVSSRQPYTLVNPGQTQRLILIIPVDRIEPKLDVNALLLRSFSGTAGIARVTFDVARSIFDKLGSFHTMRACDLADSICRLASLALHEGALAAVCDSERNTLADRIRSYINDHLRDPDLSLETLARNLNASKRSLHRAASPLNGSIHNLIWHTRLDRCRSDLLDPAKAHQSIGEIAHSWGFKNLTHFSRAFRERFGVSARETRRLGRSEL